jgi:hypothetical protein
MVRQALKMHRFFRTTFAATMIWSTSAMATESITLLGINLGMEVMELGSVLESRGYKCVDHKHNEHKGVDLECGKDGKGLYIFSGRPQGDTGVTPKGITFNCHNFNACEYSLKEVAQSIVDDGVVPEMFHQEFEFEGTHISRWCGRKGDEMLCVYDTNSDGNVALQLSYSPRGEMKFN